MPPTMWEIRLFIETDDVSVVEAIEESIETAHCGPENELPPEHRCDPPWFIVRTEMANDEDSAVWRVLLNR